MLRKGSFGQAKRIGAPRWPDAGCLDHLRLL
jgi:hypothetical protein